MRFLVFFILALFAATLSLRPDLISVYSNGLIQAYYIGNVKWITWCLLTLNWLYIFWYNKKRQDEYRDMINKIGEADTGE